MSALSFIQILHLCVYMRIDMKSRQFKFNYKSFECSKVEIKYLA